MARDTLYDNFDGLVGNFEVIDTPHAEVHDGDHYFVGGYTTKNADQVITFAVSGATGTQAHMIFDVVATASMTMEIFESGQISAGSAVTAYNSNETAIIHQM
jgi:hypothetical protein